MKRPLFAPFLLALPMLLASGSRVEAQDASMTLTALDQSGYIDSLYH